ncbi:DUF6233 domain-containing protein [Streptomyces griseorubiginosus]|uniref:DUF6233 domain-containing protein n=1 Tax=Streptomyces griseorubiginosus TaxID=67304 RepID=UPI003AF3A864
MPASGPALSPGARSLTAAAAPDPGRRRVHDDLPTELARLRVIEFHLLQQLRRVREQIYEVETGDQPWVSGPAPGWRLQRLPSAAGRPPRYVLHRQDCWIDDGQALTGAEATAWAARWDVRACELCSPNLQTNRPLPSTPRMERCQPVEPDAIRFHCRRLEGERVCQPGRSLTSPPYQDAPEPSPERSGDQHPSTPCRGRIVITAPE